MSDEKNPTSSKTATAELDHQQETPRRGTTAGLGMFDRVNELTGMTGSRVSGGMGGALDMPNLQTDVPTIAGVSDATHFTDEDDRYWRETHGSRHYANPASNYEEYQPAYRYGTDAAHRHQGKKWNEVEGDLEQGWDKAREGSGHPWHHAKEAVRAAWHRTERALPGDADGDGR
jgi:hypothetical protein